MLRLSATAVAVALVVGCGDQVSAPSTDDADYVDAAQPSEGLVPAGYDGRYRVSATVLESAEHGPQLCGSVAESLPPQCGGPDLVGWDWKAVEHESLSGTQWGEYSLVGTYDGDAFALTEPPGEPTRPGGSAGDEYTTPCPKPDGGWRPVDPERATDDDLNAVNRAASDVDGFTGVWIDQRIPDDELTEWNANDPKRLVLNVTTAGDPAEMERAVRAVWGGSVCVSSVDRTEVQLRQAQRGAGEVAGGFVSSSIDVVTAQVGLTVMVATEELQQDLDDRYGTGTVRLFGVLEPID